MLASNIFKHLALGFILFEHLSLSKQRAVLQVARANATFCNIRNIHQSIGSSSGNQRVPPCGSV